MNIEQWLDQYGYLAVFCGVFCEGPITLTLSGFLTHQGYFNIFIVLITAFAATFLTIEMFYFIGLLAGQYLLAHWPFWRNNYPRFALLLERHKAFFILGFRFLYGTQMIAPMAIGMGKIRPAYFSAMNAAGAMVWTFVLFLIGYFFGHAFEMLMDDVKQHEKTLGLVLVAALIIFYLARSLVWRRIAKDK